MLAALLIKPGIIELREMPVPKPSRGEALIRIRTALTCGTDLKAFLRGHPMIPMPGLFGHEFSGTVAETGKGVKGFKAGDNIMAVHSAPCLRCIYCRKKLYNLCENIMKTKVLGAFAEYILLPEHIVEQNLFHKPPRIDFAEAAFLEPLSCVVHGMAGINIQRGDNVLVIGAGPIGLLHVILARLKGAAVAVTTRSEKRLGLSKKTFGADTFKIADIEKAIDKHTKGIGFDFVFECTGQAEVWENSVNYVRKGGTVVLFGGCKGSTKITYDAYRLHYDEITLKGAFHFTPDNVKDAYTFLKRNPAVVSPLITGHYSLEALPAAFQNLLAGEGIKYAIVP